MEDSKSYLDFNFKDIVSSSEFWEENFKTSFFEAIEEYLEKNELSRNDFAKQIGVSRSYISQLMNGDSDHRLSKLIELAISMKKAPYLYLKDLDKVIENVQIGKSINIDFEDVERKAARCEMLDDQNFDKWPSTQALSVSIMSIEQTTPFRPYVKDFDSSMACVTIVKVDQELHKRKASFGKIRKQLLHDV